MIISVWEICQIKVKMINKKYFIKISFVDVIVISLELVVLEPIEQMTTITNYFCVIIIGCVTING